MTQVSGDKDFYTPPLRGAQVFGGIAGIISNGDQQPPQKSQQKKDLDIMTLASRSRELGAKQDMYRGTLAASWHLQAGELNAEECIEDIFAGGDGWVSNGTHLSAKSDSTSNSFKLASGASSIASGPYNKVGWWSPQRMSSASGDSVQIPIASNRDERASIASSKASSKVNLGDGGSDSDSQSAGTGGSGGSIAERRRLMRSNTRDADTKSLAGSERRKPYVSWGIETGLENVTMMGTPGSAGIPRMGRKISDGNVLKIPHNPDRDCNGRGEVDEVAAREDLKSWGKVR